jgi:hypothetical protein
MTQAHYTNPFNCLMEPVPSKLIPRRITRCQVTGARCAAARNNNEAVDVRDNINDALVSRLDHLPRSQLRTCTFDSFPACSRSPIEQV